jgi:hypothetical protein
MANTRSVWSGCSRPTWAGWESGTERRLGQRLLWQRQIPSGQGAALPLGGLPLCRRRHRPLTGHTAAEITDLLTELSNRSKPLGGLRAAAGTLGAGAMDNVRLAFIQLVLRAAGLPENLAQARFILWLRSSGLEAKVEAALKQQNRSLPVKCSA